MIDLQATEPCLKIKLDTVGIEKIRYPAIIRDIGAKNGQSVVGEWKMGVSLSPSQRATHMSRFVDELHSFCSTPFDLHGVGDFCRNLQKRLEAESATVHVRFEWFRKVKAPVSGQEALNSLLVEFFAEAGKHLAKGLAITVPVTALCPCSKAISERGAHNQRAEVRLEVWFDHELTEIESTPFPTLEFLVEVVESSASAPIFPLLKREDEKYVTEMAYDNPVFAEDLVRNIANKLTQLKRIKRFGLRAVDLESIHNHDCFAEICLDSERQ